MNTEQRILINVIGTGYDIRIGNLNKDDYKVLSEIEKQTDISLNELLFNEDFYSENKISETYNSWKDFNDIGNYRGVDLLEKGQIEVWINRKRKKRYLLSEIKEPTTLFPLFNCVEERVCNKSHQISIGLQEKGLLNKFIITTSSFQIEELKIHIVELNLNSKLLNILRAVSYKGIYLNSIKDDTLVTGTVCVIENFSK